MTLKVEGIVDRGVGGGEALGLALRLEVLCFSLASPDWQMRILHPVVATQSARSMSVLAL